MKKILFISFLFASLWMLNSACDPESVMGEDDTSSSTGSDDDGTQTETSGDYAWVDSLAESITLNTTSISTTSSDVTVSGTTATITAGGYYSISGTLSNGQLLVNAPDDTVRILLNGVTVANSSTSPFYIEKAAKVIVFLASSTTNTFTDASSYSNSGEPKACIFSNAYLAFTGSGTLKVTGKYNDGISSDDELIINNGNITVSAVDDAIRGKDYLKINDGTISATSTSTGHALKSDNDDDSSLGYIDIEGGTLTLASSTKKGAKAVNAYIQNGGDVTITKSVEGIESINIELNGGTLNITSSDDGLNATKGTVSGGTESDDGSTIVISGGVLMTYSSSGDAIDSNGKFTMSGGIVVASGPTSNVEQPLDVNGNVLINGGVLIATGQSSNMNETPSTSSSQPSLFVTSNSTISSSTYVDIQIGGTDVITFKPKNSINMFIVSSSEMTKGASYAIYTGGSYSASTNYGGYYYGGSYTSGTSKKTGTLSSSSTVNKISM